MMDVSPTGGQLPGLLKGGAGPTAAAAAVLANSGNTTTARSPGFTCDSALPLSACLACRSGAGGRGEIVEAGRGKWVDNLKYHPGANQPKKLWLPASKAE